MNLTETARRYYKHWGIIDHNGNVVSGEDKPDAHSHSDLNKRIPAKYRHATVEYAYSDQRPDMMVRTASRDGLINAIKNWSKFPHSHETVTHDHCDNIDNVQHYGESVSSHKALIHMNKLLTQY